MIRRSPPAARPTASVVRVTKRPPPTNSVGRYWVTLTEADCQGEQHGPEQHRQLHLPEHPVRPGAEAERGAGIARVEGTEGIAQGEENIGQQEEQVARHNRRKEEHTSESQSLMHTPYAVVCWKEKQREKRHSKHSQYRM